MTFYCIICQHGKEVDRRHHEEKLPWSTEWIKGCGVLPVYALNHELELDGGSNIAELKLKSKAQDTDESNWHLKNVIDELQHRSIEGSLKAKQKSSKSSLSGHALEGCFQPQKCVPIKA
ncbi:hypothetical protein P8452_25216 [Trifolium repens]|nr:hypothetical protein P8452_25216 [Trifolium repens]